MSDVLNAVVTNDSTNGSWQSLITRCRRVINDFGVIVYRNLIDNMPCVAHIESALSSTFVVASLQSNVAVAACSYLFFGEFAFVFLSLFRAECRAVEALGGCILSVLKIFEYVDFELKLGPGESVLFSSSGKSVDSLRDGRDISLLPQIDRLE